MKQFLGLALITSGAFAFVACGADGSGVSDNGFATGGTSATDSGSDSSTSGTGGGIVIDCTPGAKQCVGAIPQTCGATGWQSGTECPFICEQGACVGSCKPGTTKCSLDLLETCDNAGAWQPPTPCEFGCDPNGACKTGCVAGEFNCYGNEIRQCNPGPPSSWVPKSPATVCSPTSGQTCDAKTGTCVSVTPTGSTAPTGTYYQYAIFKVGGGSAFLGGHDVTSYGEYVYVNRQGKYLDVYKIGILDSDNNGTIQPNQHPLNPKATGPMEQRTIELVKTYDKTADNAPVGQASVSSLYAWSNDTVLSLGPVRNGTITEYTFLGQTNAPVIQPTATTAMSFFGYGHWEKRWYAANESKRQVYSYHEPTKSWVVEFAYPDMAGSHMDGMEVVVSPKTGEQFVYVSDMTSDFIGQYIKRADGWHQEALFEYDDTTSTAVEGFGFGALNHFWATSGSVLFELGGGDLQDDVGNCPDGVQACGPGLPACGGAQYCKEGCCEDNVPVR